MRNNVRILTIITSFILVISSIFQVKSFGETLNLDVYARQDFLDRSSYRERLNTSYIDSLKAKQYAEVTTWNEFATAYNDASNKAIIIKNDINRSDEAKPTTLNARKDNIIIIGENFDSSQGYYKLNLGNINLPIASLSSNNKQTFAIQNLSLYRKCIKDRFDYSQAFIAPGAITEPLATSEDYTQYWYFEFGNISSDDVDGAKDAGKGEYNGASVPRLLLGKRAQVTFYGDCEVNSAYENATVGSIIFDYGCVYKGKVCGFKNGILRNAGNLPIFSYRSTTDDASRTGNSKEFTVKEGADVHLENDNERTKYPMIYQNRDDLAYNTVLSKIVVEKYGKLYAKVNGPVLRLHQNDKFIVNENTEVHLISTADTSFTLDNNIKLEYTAIRLNADATTEVKVTSPKLFEICNLKNKTFLVWRHGNETLDFFNTNLVSWNNGSSLNGAPDRDWGYISKYRCGDNSDTTHLLTNKTTQGAIWRDESDNSTWFQPNNYQRIVCYTPTAENIELKLLPYKNVIGDPNRISDADLHADAEIYVTLHLDAGDVKFKPFERENYEVQLFSKDKEATKRSTLGFPRAIGFDPSDPGSDIDEGGQNDEYVPIDATLFATGNNISKNPRALNGKVEGTSDTVAIEWDDFLKPDQTIYYKVIRIRAELESDVNGSKPKLPITVASITPVDEENGETLSIKEGLFLEAGDKDISQKEATVIDLTPPENVTLAHDIYSGSKRIRGKDCESDSQVTYTVNDKPATKGGTPFSTVVDSSGNFLIEVLEDLDLKENNQPFVLQKGDTVQIFLKDTNGNMQPAQDTVLRDRDGVTVRKGSVVPKVPAATKFTIVEDGIRLEVPIDITFNDEDARKNFSDWYIWEVPSSDTTGAGNYLGVIDKKEIKTNWKVKAKLEEPFASVSDPSNKLDNAELYYYTDYKESDPELNRKEIKDSYQIISQGQNQNEDMYRISDSWQPKREGLCLFIKRTPSRRELKGEYSCQIKWELDDTP